MGPCSSLSLLPSLDIRDNLWEKLVPFVQQLNTHNLNNSAFCPAPISKDKMASFSLLPPNDQARYLIVNAAGTEFLRIMAPV